MDKTEFRKKFDKLIEILTTDESKANEFSKIETVEKSYDFACGLVGNMDRSLYHKAVREFGNHLDDSNSQEVSGGSSHSFSSKEFVDNINILSRHKIS